MINLLAQTQTWSFVILGGFFVVMMLLTILPQKKRQKQMKEMMSSLSVGNRVKTIGGFIGKIVSMNSSEDELVIDIGTEKEPVLVRISRAGIYMNMDAQPVNNYNTGTGGDDKPSI